MADYYVLISNGIRALDKKTSEARREYYGRARAILTDYCRKADPPLSETFIANERRTLEDAISKVEAEAILSEGKRQIPERLQAQSNEQKSGSNVQQIQAPDDPSKAE
jgi:hypothetical protein